MEPIPEDRELPTSASMTARTVASKSLLREVYTSEQIDTIVRTVPESAVPESWDFTDQPVDPEMASYYVSEPLGPTSARGSTYQYSYESHYDQPPGDDGGFSPEGDVFDASDYVHYADPSVSATDDPNIERHSTQTQKVTRVTKVTTTRSLRQIPVSGATDGYYFDPEGNALPINAEQSTTINYDSAAYSQNGVMALEYQMENSSLRQPPPGASYGDQISTYATPGSPGAPQVVDVDTTQVTLVWLHPDHEGDAGPVDGYQVQVKRPQDPQWQPAHAGFIAETQCTISNLVPNGENQFRVVAKNAAGLGQPSTPSPLVQLRPRYDVIGGLHSAPERPGVPYPPGRPQVLAVDGDRALIVWDPPVVQTTAAPVAGYQVEYRVAGTNNWVASNDFLIPECRHEVLGLRPNGDYEFRVLARNADGLSEPSASSGVVRIKPPAPKRTSRSNIPSNLLLPPSQPQVMDADSDWVTLLWAPPTVPGRYGPSEQTVGYIVESREIGDPNWYSASDRLISSTQLTVRNLRPNSTYEFRVFAKTAEGVSEPSEVSDLVQLRPKINAPPRGVPARPQAPEIMDYGGDQVTLCWLPAHSSLPVQGYDVEFRDFAQDADWYKVNDLLMQTCKMTIGDLLESHEYEFRVIAKNAMGYSEPSDPSPPTLIGPPRNGMEHVSPSHRVGMSNGQPSNQQLQDEMVRESPPLPDRDDSPPPIHRPPFSGQDGLHWRDPTLREVLDYLSSPNNIIQLNASGYLQHLTYHDNDVKEQTRELGGIRKLVDLLSSEVPEIQKNACGCLKNLSYGKENDQNKRAIRDAGGVPALASLLRKTPDMQVKEELTGALWNLSSFDDVKRPILEHASDALVRQVIVPGSGWSPDGHFDPNRQYNPNVFRNGTGILRNVSAASDTARKMLRDSPNLIDSLVHYLHLAVTSRNEADTRAVENVVCILRNLSYRVQEVEDPHYDPNASALNTSRDGSSTDRSKSAPSGSPKNLKKKESSKLFKKKEKDSPITSPGSRANNGSAPVRGAVLLWQPELVKLYLKLLQEASNSDTLEASAGALQNLAACSFEPSAEVRATVRKEKGLPILVELLRLQEDKVVCAVTTALRNLSLDQRNRELIGKYAMKDLVNKLPPPQQKERDRHVSDQTIGAVLGVLFETVRSSSDFTRNLHECGGTDRLRFLARAYPQYGTRVCKYASQVLYVMWQHKELHDGFKRAGLKESDFYSGQASRGQTTTLARPISTQGPERPHGLRPDLDDSGSTRYGAMGSTSSIPQRHSRHGQHHPDSLPMTPVNTTNGRDRDRTDPRPPRTPQSAHYSPRTPPHYDTVPTSGEPLYAQVQKRNGAQSQKSVGGDSWV